MLHKFMLLDKQSVKELLLIIKSLLIKLKKEKLKNFLFNMTDHYLLLIQEDVNLKSMVVQELELDIKNLIDEQK